MHRIAVIPGDGIGPDVINEGVRVLREVSKACKFQIEFTEYPWGAKHYLAKGEILPPNAFADLQKFSAIYLGAIGDPKVPLGLLERNILLALRTQLDLYANLRPMKLYDVRYCPLKNPPNFDILVVRENTEDLYTGPSGVVRKDTPDEISMAIAHYSRKGVERIIRLAFEFAKKRRKKVTLCDKANAIAAQEIWRKVFAEVGKSYPDIQQDLIYVDACAMAFVRRPQDFDVIVTTNLFGDILTDLGSELCGGIGLAPSGNIHPGKIGMFEPIHGSAPKYAGQNKAMPIGAILAGSMMLDFLGETKGAELIEKGVEAVLQSGKITSLGAESNLGTTQVTDLILQAMESRV